MSTIIYYAQYIHIRGGWTIVLPRVSNICLADVGLPYSFIIISLPHSSEKVVPA